MNKPELTGAIKRAVYDAGLTFIEPARLAELERIKLAHDAYVAATRRMNAGVVVLSGSTDFARGYNHALRDFSRAVLEESARQEALPTE